MIDSNSNQQELEDAGRAFGNAVETIIELAPQFYASADAPPVVHRLIASIDRLRRAGLDYIMVSNQAEELLEEEDEDYGEGPSCGGCA